MVLALEQQDLGARRELVNIRIRLDLNIMRVAPFVFDARLRRAPATSHADHDLAFAAQQTLRRDRFGFVTRNNGPQNRAADFENRK